MVLSSCHLGDPVHQSALTGRTSLSLTIADPSQLPTSPSMSRVPAEYKPYGERPEWRDLTPVPQNESSFTPMAPIMYGDEYKDATNYFRAILQQGEQSERVLELTEHIIRMNPSHYTVWSVFTENDEYI